MLVSILFITIQLLTIFLKVRLKTGVVYIIYLCQYSKDQMSKMCQIYSKSNEVSNESFIINYLASSS